MGNNLSNNRIQYAVSVDRPPASDCTPIYRCANNPSALVYDIPGVPWENIWDIFQFRLKMPGFRIRNFVGSRLWVSARQETLVEGPPGSTVQWVTYGEAEELALAMGRGLLFKELVKTTHFPEERYVKARNLRFFGVLSKNRPEWFLVELAASVTNCTLVPLYDSLSEDAMMHILNQTEMTTTACSADAFVTLSKLLIKQQSEACPPPLKHYKSHLKTCVIFDPPSSKLQELASELDIDLIYWKELVEAGRHQGKHVALPYQGRDEVGTLCYTSGTTGNPKGVMITAGNHTAIVAAHQRCIMNHPGFRTDHSDIHISYLPLAHVFERIICANCVALGVRIACYSGDTQKLLDDMKVIRPTVFLSVPRLYMRINDKVFSSVEDKSSAARFLFQIAINTKIRNLREMGIYHHPIWDPLVFGKIRKLMGGCVKYMLVGGAPLEAIVQERMSVLFCCPLLHGFGMTEMGASFICNPGERVAGHIGGVQPCLEFCLKSIPEMQYYADGREPDLCGELLVRGHSVTPGYLMNSQATDEVINKDGWLFSGDIAVLLEGNCIKIIDRKKNIFKLAQGEYVTPEKLEAIYTRASLVGQIMVHGDSSQYQLVAIVVPDEEMSAKWMGQRNLPFSSLAELCNHAEFKKAVAESMEQAAAEGELKGFEKVKNIYLSSESFTVDNDLLTPTLKLRRHVAKKRFAEQITDLYAELNQQH